MCYRTPRYKNRGKSLSGDLVAYDTKYNANNFAAMYNASQKKASNLSAI